MQSTCRGTGPEKAKPLLCSSQQRAHLIACGCGTIIYSIRLRKWPKIVTRALFAQVLITLCDKPQRSTSTTTKKHPPRNVLCCVVAEGPPRESEPRPVIQRTNGGTRERGIKWHGVCFITGARLARDPTLYRTILMCVATFRQPTDDGDETRRR